METKAPQLKRFVRGLAPFCVASLLAVGGCSSPTSPTPPVTNPPPQPNPPVNPPPSLSVTCPPATVGASATGAPIPITFSTPVTTGGLAPVQVSCTRTSGSTFALGITMVQCTATDAATQSAVCTFSVTVNPVIPRLSRTKVLAFGDSFTAGEVAVATSATQEDAVPNFSLAIIPAASYPTQLTSLLRSRYTAQTATIDVVNAGRPGEWAEDGAKRLPGVIRTARPEVLLLLQGINELAALGQAGVQRAWVAIDTMAKEGRLRGARVFIATLPPPRAGGKAALPPQQIIALNDRIRTTAIGEGAVLVDVYGALLPGVTQYVGADGVHLTEAGYRKMAETFFDAIRSDLEVR